MELNEYKDNFPFITKPNKLSFIPHSSSIIIYIMRETWLRHSVNEEHNVRSISKFTACTNHQIQDPIQTAAY